MERLFRRNRRFLAESMETVMPMGSREQLVRMIIEDFAQWGVAITPEDIEVKPHGYDARIGWDTHIVIVRGHSVEGFTNGPLPSAPPAPPDD